MLIKLDKHVNVSWTCFTFADFYPATAELQVVTPGARIGQPQFAEPWLNVATDGQNVREPYQDASSIWQLSGTWGDLWDQWNLWVAWSGFAEIKYNSKQIRKASNVNTLTQFRQEIQRPKCSCTDRPIEVLSWYHLDTHTHTHIEIIH